MKFPGKMSLKMILKSQKPGFRPHFLKIYVRGQTDPPAVVGLSCAR